MNRSANYLSIYLTIIGVLILLLDFIVLIIFINEYNQTRKIEVQQIIYINFLLVLGQAALISGIITYAIIRKSYNTPQIPSLPSAEIVALIPAYNEKGKVGTIVAQAKKYVDLVIVVDDGSIDGTAEETKNAGAIVIRHSQNMGKGAAVTTLIKAALATNAKYAVLLDADGQHDPTDIPKFIEMLRRGADHVIGNRFTLTNMPITRYLGYKILAVLHSVLIVRLKDPFSGYRGFSARALQALNEEFDPSYGIETEINYLLRNYRTAEIPIIIKYNKFSSKRNPLIQGLNILWTIIWTFLTKKSKKALIIGFIFLSISLSLLSYAAMVFNATRYIRLSYTASGILLELIATIIIACAIASLVATPRSKSQ
jgi:glycosyltransferase involved in cell wall biosynthesis